MTFAPTSTDRLLSIYLALGQYPILSSKIRSAMRQELFDRGVIEAPAFEAAVNEMARRSQSREGLRNPFGEEPAEVWDLRLSRVRDQLTDLIFSQRVPFESFEKIVQDVLSERGINMTEIMLAIHPELAPQELIFEQAMTIERLPADERAKFDARLQEAKVVLIRQLISDQLRYINIAKEWFTISDLADIRRRKIGAGRIGGKAAGMLLAHRILKDASDTTARTCLRTPESFFIGSDVMYTFMSINNLYPWNDQKYKSETEMRAEYAEIVQDFEKGEFPPDVLQKLQSMLAAVEHQPLIVRSSSLLEDNFGTSFAGKYESVFCPNQGSPAENLRDLTRAIKRIYASTLNPNALLYRRSKGLADYDERMAVLVQVVEGEKVGRFFFPQAAGVAFSRNLYRWAPQIRREDGFVRLVWGLGTRAVDRVGSDFPRLVALSHPLLRPSNEPKSIHRYSQQYIDLIDLEDNTFRTLPVGEVFSARYAPLRYLVQQDEDGYFSPLRTNLVSDTRELVLTFDELLRRTPFAEHMREVLKVLERAYRTPVDLEFTLEITGLNGGSAKPDVCITLLQCRPQSQLMPTDRTAFPTDLPAADVIFRTRFVVPEGRVDRVDWVVFVPPEGYFALPSMNARKELARAIGRLNDAMKDEKFICVGPGRWGSSNADLGVPIDYG
ncbi:MAG TPA: PEP/pyruvate-binding domain-containing protein, partial [Anaerolineaceae bacterium]|nr:PEP/pyruvate-binding domain-containing protein [Anaerolineaceae bacterium]